LTRQSKCDKFLQIEYTIYNKASVLEDLQESYTTQQAADIIGVHKNTLLNWIRSGKVNDARRDWKGYRIWTGEDVRNLLEHKSKYMQMKLDIT